MSKEIFYTRLADNNLILGHRLSEWCGHGPELEQDIALINVALDLIGQARNLYIQLGELKGVSEDEIAYKRDAHAFYNFLICELENGHFGTTMMRQFLFDAYHNFLLEQLTKSEDDFLKTYALKSIKEVRYHLEHSKKWVLRLGDGTQESHDKMQEALNLLWPYALEFLAFDKIDEQFLDTDKLEKSWHRSVKEIIDEATLNIPENTWPQKGGKKGNHTEHLGYILADMQFLQRAYPDAQNW